MPAGRVVGLFVKEHVPGEPGLPKQSVPEVELTPGGVRGDFNNFRTEELQGDPDSAVLLLPHEILDELRREGWPVHPGDLGENVGTRGIAWPDFRPGRTVRLGRAELRTTRECTPCERLRYLPYVGNDKLPAFLRATLSRRGWYARVVRPGSTRIGDAIEID
ncbi:MAG: MOSC domain-containing protein [Candidatus Thermoplasmatota archaeon]|jgi:MOSC domain-containing protein YiiM|nr:MOSC domain-containing protein [Candidatus Thermoplasmatota archaeon]MCL5983844.1 MOSC domain-containing protein [Candidatus Thermoplasmatota archaeon]